MSYKEKKLLFMSAGIGILLIIISYSYQIGVTSGFSNQDTNEEEVEKVEEVQKEPELKDLEVGEPGSTHAHMTFVLMINGQMFNFNRDRYTERSQYVHFHEEDGIVIHKHAEEVSLPYFLETLGIELGDDCLTLDQGDEYCENTSNKIRMVVNGKIIEDPERYELIHGDRILLDYSNDSDTEVRVRAQTTIPDVPPSLMEDNYNTY